MSWIDIVFIVVMVIFVALGARAGSLWTGACLIGGFFGAFLVEYYMLPVSEMLGGFTGAKLVAGFMLFLGGVVIALVPGWALSRLAHVMLLGFVDTVMGLLTGFLTGLVVVTLAFLFILPHTPAVEKSKAWKKSHLVKPLHHFVEDFFSDSRFQQEPMTEQLSEEFMKDFSPAIEETTESIKSATSKLTNKIKKK